MADNLFQIKQSTSVGTGKNQYKCTSCSKVYKLKSSLKRHVLVQCAAEKLHECKLCGMSFKTEGALTRHTAVHSKEKSCNGSVCDNRTCKIKGNLKNHICQHSKEVCLSCTVSVKGFQSKGHLTRQGVVHSEDRMFQCAECPRAFRTRKGLSSHQLVHIVETPFECEKCGKSFKRTYQLNYHRKKHDSAIKQSYPCEQCSKVYQHKGSLKYHQLSHAGGHGTAVSADNITQASAQSAPNLHVHSLEMCGQSSTEEIGLNSHVKTHPKNTSLPQEEGLCKVPYSPFSSNSSLQNLLNAPTPTIIDTLQSSKYHQTHQVPTQGRTDHIAVSNRNSDIPGMHNFTKGKLLTRPNTTRQTEDTIRETPVLLINDNDRLDQRGGSRSLALASYGESIPFDYNFLKEGNYQDLSQDQHSSQRYANWETADPRKGPHQAPSDILEEIADMMDGVEERKQNRLGEQKIFNHHYSPQILQ